LTADQHLTLEADLFGMLDHRKQEAAKLILLIG